MMYAVTERDELIVATSWKPSRRSFLSVLDIHPGGLGAQLFNRVYDALFVESLELQEEYRKYYSWEYATFQEYLEFRYDLVLEDKRLAAKRVFFVCSLPQVVDSNYSENELNTVLDCISRLEEDG